LKRSSSKRTDVDGDKVADDAVGRAKKSFTGCPGEHTIPPSRTSVSRGNGCEEDS
jgi:hypothetical protein